MYSVSGRGSDMYSVSGRGSDRYSASGTVHLAITEVHVVRLSSL